MTFFHFINCVALAYVPYFLTYKFSGLAEYNAFWKCVQAGGAYLFTQLCKMLLLATFFPESEATSGLDIVGDFMKSTMDLIDLIGIHLVMTRIAGKGEIKFMVAGVGWATAELLMTRILPLWVGARGVEFDWKYVQMSFDSNICLIQHIATAALVWLWSRHDLNKSLLPVVVALLALSYYKALIVQVLTHAMGLGAWSLLAINTMFTSTVALIALQMYIGLTRSSANSY